MSYGMSLEDAMSDAELVSRKRVLRELRAHDIRSEAEIATFDREVSPANAAGEYAPSAVLSWLGY